MSFVFLVGAILGEVLATLSLRMQAESGQKRWIPPVVAGYLASFTSLALALDRGLGIGVAYGIWSAFGIVLTAIAGHLIFGDVITRRMVGGMGFIVVGVLAIELGANH